jgi:hypothetical protein
MSVASLSERTTVPLGVAVLGGLVLATGRFMLDGMPFLVGCGLTFVFALAGVVLVTARSADR